MKQEEFETAVTLLQPLDRKALRKKYKDIETLYLTACEGAGIEAYPATPDPEAESTPEAAATPAPEGETEEADEATAPPFLVTEDEPA